MKIFKIALALAGAMLASQGQTFDLTHLAIKAVSGAIHVPASNPHGQRVKIGQNAEVDPANLQLPASTGSFSACQATFANGEPPRGGSTEHAARPLCFNGFAVLYSPKTKTPIYSAEVLNRERIHQAKGEQRTNVFFEDARLPLSERALLNDYRGSGYDRGHTSPAGDQASPESMGQSFSLANMVPQSQENNRFAWADIEKATRKYVERASGNVYVITGPAYEKGQCPFVLVAQRQLQAKGFIVPSDPGETVREAVIKAGFKAPYRYDADACTIGASKVAVPSYLFKLVYDANTKRAWAHWLQNTDWAKVGKPISYEELVQRTGINFLPGYKAI